MRKQNINTKQTCNYPFSIAEKNKKGFMLNATYNLDCNICACQATYQL